MAGFVGTANVLSGALARRFTGGDRAVAIRPVHVRLGPPLPDQLSTHGTVIDVQFHGATSRMTIAAEGTTFSVSIGNGAVRDRTPIESEVELGAPAQISWSREAMVELGGAGPP